MTQDILAVSFIGAGSSWGRAETLEEAIANCKRCLERDWGSIFYLDGKEATISCYDVTGNDVVRFEHHQLMGDNEDEYPITLIEHRDVTLKGDKRR